MIKLLMLVEVEDLLSRNVNLNKFVLKKKIKRSLIVRGEASLWRRGGGGAQCDDDDDGGIPYFSRSQLFGRIF